MGVFEAKISAKGQVTVPIAIRKKIGAKAGGHLQFRLSDEGKVELTVKKSGLSHIKGIFGTPSKPVDIENEIMDAVWERNMPPKAKPKK